MSRDAFEALERLAGGLGTAILAFLVLISWIMVAAACLVGVGLLMIPPMLALTRTVAERERGRLNRWGLEVVTPYPQQDTATGWAARIRAALRDPATFRDLGWVAAHATLGLTLGLVAVLMPMMTLRDATLPFWWGLLPPGNRITSYELPITTFPAVLVAALAAVVVQAIAVVLAPRMARLQALTGVRLLRPHPSIDLSRQVARLTATRAGALRAHATELRRIERALHDGAQNRLVAVVVTVAVAKRALAREASRTGLALDGPREALDEAQSAAEQAVAELRGVVRGILPPVLEDRGLSGALSALAAGSAVPCALTADDLGQLPLSVETTAYFAVAEALTNVAKHSGARRALVEVRRDGGLLRVVVSDDGKGGASEADGTGLGGIRRRVEAHDGTIMLTSPRGGPTTIEVELPCGS
ncbi:sensor histidine kinase [Streptosporangium sp. NPDC001559]|uniref:sensor histidine kinase n=1 Tax=Streptosporangium sp. NPDC001559 TaxID=3366187 RepID=UPI0036EC9C40